MAITFIDSDVVDSAAALNISFAIPAGAIAGDFMIAFVKQSENTSQQTWDDDGGGGNGWIQLYYNRTTGGRDQETSIYYKIHSGSESNPTFTWWGGGTTSEPISGSLLVYRGVDTVTPIADSNFMEAQNDANPPNPSVTIAKSSNAVVVFHAATHDDISAVSQPTGYTLRTQVWNGVNDDHRNHFTADLIGGFSVGTYSPPDWQHSVLNTTPEYHTYSIAIQEPSLIGISSPASSSKINWGDNAVGITGFGFGAVQNSGKVEFWSDTIGTIKQVQTVNSWADGSIEIDTVQGSLSNDTSNYLVVTNDNGDVTTTVRIIFGLIPYQDLVISLSPDHFWSFNGDYNDTGVGGAIRDATTGVVGTHPWISNIAEDATQSMQFDDILDRREIVDSPYMNVTISAKERTMAGWIMLGGVQKSMAAIWKEGGGVQNLAFLTGLGNVLLAQLADVAGSRDNVQAIAEIRLTPFRPYHICLRYSHLETTKEMRLYVDGEEQPLSLTDGNPMVLGIFDSHGGDVTWGNSDNNLEMGTVDVAFSGQEDCAYQHWCSWSDNSPNSGALEKVTEIRDVLFRRGALPKYTITSDTEVNMQAALDVLGTIEVEDYPLGIRVEAPSGGANLTLTATGITFNPRTTMQLEWRGVGQLTYVVSSNSELDESKLYSSGGGTIIIERPASLTINGLIVNSEVRIYDDDGVSNSFGTELDGVESNPSNEYIYSHAGIINGIIVQIMVDGYVEIKIPLVLGSTDQTLTITPVVEEN